MLAPLEHMLYRARQGGYAVGAFNIYNLEGALAVIQAAKEMDSPIILQVLPSALAIGGDALIALCRSAADKASTPVAVHLDHCSSRQKIITALEAGVSSVMADGSALDFEDNIGFTTAIVQTASQFSAGVEAELGYLAGTEDGVTVEADQASLTQPDQAVEFVEKTGVAALAVCIGNRHGAYHTPPELDFERLSTLAEALPIPLVLHGTSGLSDDVIVRATRSGVCKFNVNTEIRTAYINKLKAMMGFGSCPGPELVEIMKGCIAAMKIPIKSKIRLFGSAGKAEQ